MNYAQLIRCGDPKRRYRHGRSKISGSTVLAQKAVVEELATFRRKKPFSDDRATNLGARTRRQVGADKL
jgi:hypothetical protein